MLGINAAGDDPAALASAVASARAVGVHAIRVRIDWAAVEATRGAPDWRILDAAARAARAGDVRWLAVVDSSPAWARRDPPAPAAWWTCPVQDVPDQPSAAPPTEPADLGRFIAAFAARYRDVLIGLEVWREPNVLPHWRRGGPDPEDYAALLVAAAGAARTAAPGLPVISAGLAPTTDVGVCAMSDYVYLDRLARTGALDRVDGVGIQISGFGLPADHPDVGREALDARRAELLARVLARHDVARPIWIVAAERGERVGAADAAPRGSAVAAPRDDGAAWFSALWDLARAEWPWSAAVFVGGQAPPRSAAAGASASRPDALSPVDAAGAITPLGTAMRLAAADASPLAALTPAGAAEPGPSTNILGPFGDMFAARIVRPWPALPAGRAGRLGAVVALALLGMLAALAAADRPLARRPARWAVARLRTPARRPAWQAVGAMLVLLGLDCVVPWPLNAPLVPCLVLAAAMWPLAVAWTIGVAAPFYFAAYKLGAGPALGPRSIGPVELLVLAAVVGAAGRWWLERAAAMPIDGVVSRGTDRRRPVRALDVGVLALVCWAALSPLWAEEPALAAREWRTVILEPALFYALLRLARDRRASARAAWQGLVVGSTAAAAWGLAAWGFGAAAGHVAERWGGAVLAEGVVRASGPYNSPNNLALVLGRVVVGIASGWVYARTGGGGRSAAGPRPIEVMSPAGDVPASGRSGCSDAARPLAVRLAGGAAFATCAAALIATFSRGTILVGLPVSAAWLILVAGRGRLTRRAIVPALAVVVAVALLLAPFAGTERVSGALALRPGTTLYYRVRLWQSAWRMGVDHPVLGVGLDNFMGLYRDRYVQRDVAQERFLSHPHNVALDWWTRLGLPGAVLLALWLAGIVRAAARAVRSSNAADRVMGLTAVGSLVYGLAHGLLDNSFFLVDLALVTWIAQSMVLAALDPPEDRWAHQDLNLGPTGYEPAALTAEL